MIVSAPGKAVLCGEYAVLDGGHALVAAVDRFVYVRPLPGCAEPGTLPGPEVRATLEAARREFGPLDSGLEFDVGSLFKRGKKLGLGSSAACSVAAAALAAVAHGLELSDRATRDRVFTAALAGHRAVAPQGSGVDVAASAYGGFLRFALRGRCAPSVKPVSPPALELSLVWTGTPVRTSDLLGQVHTLRESQPAVHANRFAQLHSGNEAFTRAFLDGDAAGVLEAVQRYCEAMSELGVAAGAPVVDARLRAITKWALAAGGAAKPCGAGGGDVAVAFFPDVRTRDRFESRCQAEGFTALGVSWGAPGARLHEQEARRHRSRNPLPFSPKTW